MNIFQYKEYAAVEQTNIYNDKFYIKVMILEVTPKGYVITEKGTYDHNNSYREIKEPSMKLVLIDENIEQEIRKLEIRKYIHNYLSEATKFMSLQDLMVVEELIKKSLNKV